MALHPSLTTTLAALIAASVAVAGCGGGNSGDGPSAGSQTITPNTPSAATTAAGDAASAVPDEAASAASAAAAASAASAVSAGIAPAVSPTMSKSLGAAATSTTASPVSKAAGTTADSPVFIAPRATVGTTDAATSAAAADSATSDGPTAKAMAMANTTTGKPCVLDVTRSFGTACFAAATKTLADGTSSSFPNAKPGYRGSTTASCKAGVVTWSQETCTAMPSLTTPMAATLSAAKTVSSTASQAQGPEYNIGVYYFGGWKDNQMGASSPTPWVALRRYPDREPLLGYYAEDASGIMSQQLKWMNQAGIDFVVFNWYWARHNAPMLDHAVKAYLAVPNKPAVKFAVQWSNHTETNFSRDQLDAMFKYWVTNYFKRPEYQLYNGKPVVYIFSAPTWARNATAIGMTSAQLINRLNDAAKAAGLPGVSVIGGLWGGDKTQDYSVGTGFAATTLYNYHSPASIALQPTRSGNYSRSYAELHQSYANQWDWMIKNTKLNYIVPMTSGWDNRPWGGSKDPLHDDSRSLPAEFALHLQAAKAFMETNAARTQRTGVVCCWNEFGEGSFIEPTKADGTKYLDQVRAVFGNN